MPKLTVAVLTLALAGVAHAGGWRSLRVDASSEAAFAHSLAVFREELPPARQQVFAQALFDIWRQGTADAEANQREYTANDYHVQLHGLSYEEVVTFTDPTGATAKARHRDAERGQVGPSFPRWQNPYGASQEARARRAHRELDTGAAVRTGVAGRSGQVRN
jgi:hypothetical protein